MKLFMCAVALVMLYGCGQDLEYAPSEPNPSAVSGAPNATDGNAVPTTSEPAADEYAPPKVEKILGYTV